MVDDNRVLVRPPSRATQPDTLEQLSRRERDVLELLARGLSNDEIAQTLTIAVNTVKMHVKNIYAKLNVRNRTQAAVRARELRLV
jgi:LuxR family maltose regulon positive regulatory protein